MAAARGSAATWEDSHSLAEVVPAARMHDISLDAARTSTQGSRKALSRGALCSGGRCYRDLGVMAVKSDNLGSGKDLFPLQPCLGEEGIFAASCYLHCKSPVAAVLYAVFRPMHAAFSGGGTKNNHIDSKIAVMCLPAKPHPLILCYKPVVSVMVWFWARGAFVFIVLRSVEILFGWNTGNNITVSGLQILLKW